jgi:hypothetical protein
MTWILCSDKLPPENTVVDTKIDDKDGLRNEQSLQKIGNLWWLASGDMYVYYRPTHWRYK